VVSGGYEDDEDYGDVIIYTGHGGNDPATRKQIADQELTRGNLALARNAEEGLPVRVIRGAAGDRAHSPADGFRYDGLFYVERFWHTVGRSGFRVWQYRLVRSEPSPAPLVTSEAEPSEPVARATMTVQRLVRSSAVGRRVKELHDHRCQVCGVRIETPAGPYAEGAHIRPLGRPHDGPDVESNVLCLCPNDHVRFDAGAIYVDDAVTIFDSATGAELGELATARGHVISGDHLAYHRTTVAVLPG
jgi:putative restriction endonuclease